MSHDLDIDIENICGKSSKSELEQQTKKILDYVYTQLKVKGYDPVRQITGYLLTEDPTYITNYNGARVEITKIDRDDALRWMLEHYIESKQFGYIS